MEQISDLALLSEASSEISATPIQEPSPEAPTNHITNPASPPPPNLAPGPTPEEATSFLTSLLDRPLRVTLKDNRTVIGRLYVIDHGGNMVLSEAEEFPANLIELFDVNRESARSGLNGDEEEKLYWKSERIRAEINERWERGEKWLPKSEPFGGPGTGWGGRGLGLVLAKMEDVTRIELLPEDGEVQVGGGGPDMGTAVHGQGMDWSLGVA